jgi:ketosteroid isomerase-like protein
VAASFLAMKGRLEFTSDSVLQAKDMALKTYEWKFKGNDVHGNPVTLVGRAATVLRRQTDRGYGLFVMKRGELLTTRSLA